MGRTAAMRQDGEPSVDEILASIKKVIARENRSDAAELRRRRERDGMGGATRTGQQPGDLSDGPEPADPDEAEDVLDLGDIDLAGVECPDPDDGGGRDGAGHAGDDRDGAGDGGADGHAPGLLGDAAQASVGGSLAALALLARPGAAPRIVRSGETSLEGLARDLLRPMLAEWLDTHLPPMVERMVADEIARIAKPR